MMFEDKLEHLSEERIEGLVRQSELGELNFSTAVEDLKVLRPIVIGFAAQDRREVPDDVFNQASQKLDALQGVMQQMESFTLAQDNSASQHQSLSSQVDGLRKWFVGQVRPHIRQSAVDTSATKSELDRLMTQVSESSEAADELLAKVRRLSGETGAGELSGYYRQQAEEHHRRARQFLVAAATSGLVTVIAAFFLFESLPAATADGAVAWSELIRGLVVRAFYLGLLTYVIAFLIRGYRSNAHLRVINEQKKNALDTYGLFAEAATSDDARDLISAELVRTVFSVAESGLLGETSTERPVADGQLGLLGLLLSRRPTQ